MSFWELVLICLVAVVVIKPERLPEIAYLLGQLFARLRVWHHNILKKYNPFA